MPIEVRLDLSKPVFRVTGTGRLQVADFVSALSKVQQTDGYRPEIPILWDLSEQIIPKTDKDLNVQLWDVSRKGVELAIRRGGVAKAAAVAQCPRVKELVRVYLNLTQGSEIDGAIFEELEAAENWLFS